MSETLRFPLLKAVTGVGPDESSLVLTLGNALTQLALGGEANYTSLAPWKLDVNATETPFGCAVIEFIGSASGVIGDGTIPIGLYGGITLADGTIQKTLLGILGVNYAGTTVPQIPIVAQGGGDIVGFSQPIANVAAYDSLSIGGVTSNIAWEGFTVTVKARPLRRRAWLG